MKRHRKGTTDLKVSSVKDTGLRGINVADTSISLIDGANGRLYYRGYDIRDLAKHATYEETAYLLLYGAMPTSNQLAEFRATLASERAVAPGIIQLLREFPASAKSMDVLQSSVSMLAANDPELSDESKEAINRKGCRLISKIPTVLAAWQRIRKGFEPISPDERLSRAANFLYMLTGEKPRKEITRNFDVCLLIHAEHSFNASAFAARVVASTRAHVYASTGAALGALSGKLHGGANAQVMMNLISIGSPDKVDEWVRRQLDAKKRIMGMGHAVYRTTDPRAVILRQMSERLGKTTRQPKWYGLTKRVEEVTRREFKRRKGRDIFPNVDLYSASVYYMMGIEPDLFTSVFALARLAGWIAHIVEEKFPEPPVKPMLYRPSAVYRGNYCGEIGCTYVPISKRNLPIAPNPTLHN